MENLHSSRHLKLWDTWDQLNSKSTNFIWLAWQPTNNQPILKPTDQATDIAKISRVTYAKNSNLFSFKIFAKRPFVLPQNRSYKFNPINANGVFSVLPLDERMDDWWRTENCISTSKHLKRNLREREIMPIVQHIQERD